MCFDFLHVCVFRKSRVVSVCGANVWKNELLLLQGTAFVFVVVVGRLLVVVIRHNDKLAHAQHQPGIQWRKQFEVVVGEKQDTQSSSRITTVSNMNTRHCDIERYWHELKCKSIFVLEEIY